MVGGWAKWIKGVNSMVMDGKQTCDGDHSVVYIGIEVQCSINESYIIKNFKKFKEFNGHGYACM